MIFALALAIGSTLAGGAAAPAGALSWSRVEPHEQKYALCEARKIADYINYEGEVLEERAERDDKWVGYPDYYIYTTALGVVGNYSGPEHTYLGDGHPAHAFDFVETMRKWNGKADKGPIVASRLVVLDRDKYLPVYLLNLRRKRWERYTTYPAMEDVEEYQDTESTWIVQFKGNSMFLLRQADELAPLAARRRDLLTKRIDCKKLWAERES